MVWVARLELATSWFQARPSTIDITPRNTLKMAGRPGIEPGPKGSEPSVLPLHYLPMVPREGIEPPQHGSKPCVLPLDDLGYTRPNCASLPAERRGVCVKLVGGERIELPSRGRPPLNRL